MSDSSSDSPSRRPDLDRAGVHPQAHSFVEGLETVFRGCVILARAAWRTSIVAGKALFWGSIIFAGLAWRALIRGIDWLRADRRNLVIGGLATTAAIFLGVLLTRPALKDPVGPPLLDHFTYTVVQGDNPSVIAARFGVALDDLVRDNLGVFARHAATCQDRNVSARYLKGELKAGSGKRRTEVCVVEKLDGVEVALGTLRPGDKLLIACSPETANYPECQTLVAYNAI